MFTQVKVLQPGVAEEADLIDDIPDVETYKAPFATYSSNPPDGYFGISAFWEIVDADEKPLALVFCLDAAREMVRLLNNRRTIASADADRIVVHITRP
jgi:hypothetical protein